MKRNEFLSELSFELEGLPQKVRSDMLHDYDDHFASGLEQGRTEEEIAKSLGDPRALGRELRSQYTSGYNATPPPSSPPSRELRGQNTGAYNASLPPPSSPRRELGGQNTGAYSAPPPPPPPRPRYQERPERPSFSFMRFLWMTFVMGMFNLIFVLGPYIGLLGVLIGLWGAALGLGLGGIAAVFATIFPFTGDAYLFFNSSGLSFITVMAGAAVCSALGFLFGMGCWYTTKWMFKWTVKYISWNFKVIIGRRY